MVITFVTIICVLFSMYLFRSAAGSISLLHLNTVSYVMYFQIFTMAVVGSVLVANNMVDYHYMISPVSNQTKLYAWIGVMYSIIAMPLGMILLNNILKVKNIKQKLRDYSKAEIECGFSPNNQNYVILGFTIFSTIILIYVLTANNIIPIVELLKGHKDTAAIGRITVRRDFGGIEYIKNLLGLVLIPIFAYYSYILWNKNKSLIRLILMLILNFNALFLLVYDTQKAPFIFFLFGYIILFTFTKNGISRLKLILFSFTALLLVALNLFLR